MSNIRARATRIAAGRHRASRLAQQRSASGITIIEALVAVLIGALISGIFLDVYSKLQRVSFTTQNEICANVIAQEMIGATRAIGYDVLAPKAPITYTLLSNRVFVGDLGPDIRSDPLFLDLVKKYWLPKVANARFPGQAIYTISPASGFAVTNGLPDAIEVKLVVTWSDGERYQQAAPLYGRKISTSVILTKTGLNKWTP